MEGFAGQCYKHYGESEARSLSVYLDREVYTYVQQSSHVLASYVARAREGRWRAEIVRRGEDCVHSRRR